MLVQSIEGIGAESSFAGQLRQDLILCSMASGTLPADTEMSRAAELV